ncbi:MAG TPA: ABC transporter ATP-binding protein [Caldilineaceae bacterium]|nr:ABC transporter ATP-binding protein [Caldilineaceae bacterium]
MSESSTTKPVAVELRKIVKQFPDGANGVFTAVDHVDLQIYDGEFFSLLGPSGCGKTTTLRMIAGLELPTSGNIVIHGKEMANEPAFRRPVNTVFQRYALFPHMSVRDNVAFGLRMRKTGRREIEERVNEVLKLVRLETMGSRRPDQLSGGQQQRVALARALVNRPEVLLLDEPLAALDLKLRQAMREELKRIQKQVGITFIFVTHDQEEALTMSDRIAVMNDGVVLQVGKPYDIYEDPTTRFVADFIGETNFLTGTLIGGDGQRFTVNLDNGAQTIVNCDVMQAQPGARVTIAIRPEKIFLGAGAAPDAQENSYTGRVEEIIYIGTDTYYHIRLAGDLLVVARQQNQDYTGKAAMLAEGDTAYISWRAHNASLLTE